jgi:CBS domain containing-hemolysin-like protein
VLKDERGLVGKIVILWLVFLAVFVVAAFDAGSIALTRYRVTEAASNAAREAANVFKQTGDRNQAYQAAVELVNQEAPGARIPAKDGFSIEAPTGRVTVVVVKKASTLIAGRIGFLESLTRAKVTDTSGPSTV